MKITRRNFSAGTLSILAMPLVSTMAAENFSQQNILAMAKRLSQKPHQPSPSVPKAWQDLTYEQYKSIWFNEKKAIWQESEKSYRVDLFHPGLYFPRPIKIYLVENGKASELKFDIKKFDRTDKVPELPIDETLGYSGFRLRTELNAKNIFEEFCVFQGASYFRAIAKGQIYGLSARGLALNTASEQGEEFPEFTHFWLEATKGKAITVHALLDSKSVVGVFKFKIEPEKNTVMHVSATLLPRTDLTNVGIAPLTSMFLFDETNRERFSDFRPAVHDSEGVQILNRNGEVLWRPLANPKHLQTSFFIDNESASKNKMGFGLMQRSRKFSNFADLQAKYHRRPSLWVQPDEDWGSSSIWGLPDSVWGNGSVQLVEIPADKEIYDNIVAFWRVRKTLQAGKQYNFAYKLIWGEQPFTTNVAKVINTRIGKRAEGKGYIATVDFENHQLTKEEPENYIIHVSSPQAKVSEGVLQRNPETKGLRLAFTFEPKNNFAELRCQLRGQSGNITEVWLYRWTK